MKKSFFLISQVFYPDEVSTAGLFTNLCEVLAQKDIDVQVWCAQPSYNTKKRQKSKLKYKNINITYLPSTSFNKNSILGRLINYSSFSISLTLKLLLSRDKSTIFTSTNPPFIGILISVLASLKKRKFIYIVQDIFPDGLIKLKKIKEDRIITKFWKKLNQFTLRKANKIIIIGRDMINWVESTYPPAKNKTLYIPIWQDKNLTQPIEVEKNEFIKENDLSNKFIVQYSGNMGLWNDMKTFSLGINRLYDQEITFIFIGDGIRKKDFIENLNEESIKSVQFFPFQPKEKLNLVLSACHIALVSLNKGLEGIAVPSKIMGILAAGTPVIAMVPDNSEIAHIIKEHSCGIVLEPGDYISLAEAILRLKNDLELRTNMGNRGRNAFLEKYSSLIISEEYIKLL